MVRQPLIPPRPGVVAWQIDAGDEAEGVGEEQARLRLVEPHRLDQRDREALVARTTSHLEEVTEPRGIEPDEAVGPRAHLDVAERRGRVERDRRSQAPRFECRRWLGAGLQLRGRVGVAGDQQCDQRDGERGEVASPLGHGSIVGGSDREPVTELTRAGTARSAAAICG